jgi:glycerol-3-phosphate O-acyltransferase / dihydroxyacetone phosphate acyltransferase
MIVELNRRLVKGYTKYKDDPRIVKLRKSVVDYNRQLMQLNIRDHQVEYAKLAAIRVIFTLLYRLAKLALLSTAVLPGLILFAPIFVAGKIISIKKSKEALAASTVKIQARDVIATWKLLVALVLSPALNSFYTIVLLSWTYYNRVQGYVPEFLPLWSVFLFGFFLFPTITFAALRFGEVGMDILKSLRPLVLCLNPTSGNTLVKLRKRRAALVIEVTNLINTLGPEMFPDFESARIIADPFKDEDRPIVVRKDSDTFSFDSVTASSTPSYVDSGGANAQGNLPRNDSFRDIGRIGLFASRPGTPSHSHSRSSSSGVGFQVQGFSTLDSKGSFEEVSKRIRGAMKERNQRRKSENGKETWEEGSENTTPGSEHGKKDI